VAEAKRLDHFARAEQAEEEIAALLAELSRAVGLGGRDRRAASAAERARQSVTRALKTVVKRIAEQEPALGALFVRCIKTGTYCSYTLDPGFPITWEIETALGDATTGAPERLPASTPLDSQRAGKGIIAAGEFLVPQRSSAHRATFVGRQAECDQVRTLVDQALIGHGSFVLLNGGAGIGKTRLAMEIAEYASRQGCQILRGQCYEREAHPYMPFVEMLEMALAQARSLEQFRQTLGDNAAELAQMVPRLRCVFPDIPPPLELPTQQARRYLFQSLTVTLAREAHRVPQFLIVDDLQWAEESTLALLTHLAHRVAQLPVVIVGTYRDNDLDRNPALVRTLEELIRTGFPPLKLQGLSYEAVAQLLQDLSHREPPPHLVRVIFEETQGNPFFVEEVYKHLVEEGKIFDTTGQFRVDLSVDEVDVPDNVSLVLRRRLEQLNEKARHVLGAAAVIGRSFSFPVLESLLEQKKAEDLLTALEEAQRMGLIAPNVEGPEALFSFAHELVRQTLLAGFTLPRRQRLHIEVAEAIERVHTGAVHERAGDIAHHLVKAGSLADSQKVVHYLTLAEEHAIDAAAYEDALRQVQSSLLHGDAIDSRQRAQLLSDLAMAEHGLGK
jgi:predicted ATPase